MCACTRVCWCRRIVTFIHTYIHTFTPTKHLTRNRPSPFTKMRANAREESEREAREQNTTGAFSRCVHGGAQTTRAIMVVCVECLCLRTSRGVVWCLAATRRSSGVGAAGLCLCARIRACAGAAEYLHTYNTYIHGGEPRGSLGVRLCNLWDAWPSHDIATANIVRCMVYTRGVGRGSYIAQ